MRLLLVALTALLLGSLVKSATAEGPTAMSKFSFGTEPRTGYIQVAGNAVFSDALGYGFETQPDTAPAQATHFTSDHPFFFSARVAEGNYRVTVTLGDPKGESNTTIKAEGRRLIAEQLNTATGKTVTRQFTVNARSAEIEAGKSIQLNDRERTGQRFKWDDKLTLEFSGPRPCIQTIDIEPATDAITVYIAGDSTVCDQPNEPWCGWGQTLPRFFNSRVAVANYAESGRALYSFRSERRLDKILSVIKPGDYLFIQFGHNDQKDKRPGAGAMTTYKADLEQYIAAAKSKGATPMLVTPMYRRRFDAAGTLQESLGEFPAAVRLVAKEQHVALIDLHETSGRFFQALGVEGTKAAFVHYPADTFPGQNQPLKDDTHFNTYGAYELARCVVEGIRTSDLPLAKELADDVKPFDPSKPDAVADFHVPPSPYTPTTKPEGN